MSSREQAPPAGPDPRGELARRLRALRTERGLTLRELAARSGYSPASMSNTENAARLPSWPVVAAYVQSCHGDPEQWRQLWELARSAPVGAEPPPAPDRRRRWAKVLTGRRRLFVGGVIGLAVVAVGLLTMPSPVRPAPAAQSRPMPAPPPVWRTGTVTLRPGEYLDLDSAAPDWNRGVAPDPTPHDVTFSATLRTLLSDDAGAMTVLGTGGTPGYADCLYGTYGQALTPADIRQDESLCVTTESGRRALLVITGVHTDTAQLPDQLTLRLTVWQLRPDPADAPPPAHPVYDHYGCVDGGVTDSVTVTPTGDARAAGWNSSRPTPWGAPQCRDQIWWTPYVTAGMTALRRFTWQFDTARPGITCTLWADYPPPPSGHSAGTAHYSINDGTQPAAPQLAYRAVVQENFMGSWHSLGTYRFASGHISVTLDNSGSYPNPEQGVIAGPMRAACG